MGSADGVGEAQETRRWVTGTSGHGPSERTLEQAGDPIGGSGWI